LRGVKKDIFLAIRKYFSRFSKLVYRLLVNSVQINTRHGKTAEIIREESENPAYLSSGLGDFLSSSPLVGSGLEVTRDSSTPRDVGLE
jgi:hypothetical protein